VHDVEADAMFFEGGEVGLVDGDEGAGLVANIPVHGVVQDEEAVAGAGLEELVEDAGAREDGGEGLADLRRVV
jgi:hypothetical protein